MGWAVGLCVWQLAAAGVPAQDLVVYGERVYTMAGPAIANGVVVIRDGKIAAVGKAAAVDVPKNVDVLRAKIVTPGLIDAHTTVGVAGMLNQDEDQDQLESSAPVQPALRAIDAYNGRDELVAWVRGFGVTTLHTGHAPGELISGQTMVVKTGGKIVERSVLVAERAIACTLASSAQKSGSASPGTRGKMMAMLRAELLKAQEYQRKLEAAQDPADRPGRDLNLEALAQVLQGRLALMITAERAQDISNALRLQREFKITVWLDGASEAYLVLDEIKKARAPVILHPTMARAVGDRENLSFETAAQLKEAKIPFVLQSGYESYVPKTRVVLFEAAWAAANGLSREAALASITLGPARLLGIADRVGSLEPGKDGDVALYDGDPFEYTTHCVGVVIEGEIVSAERR
jgi:imidazolonepropionase-like amidohydrolase